MPRLSRALAHLRSGGSVPSGAAGARGSRAAERVNVSGAVYGRLARALRRQRARFTAVPERRRTAVRHQRPAELPPSVSGRKKTRGLFTEPSAFRQHGQTGTEPTTAGAERASSVSRADGSGPLQGASVR